MKLKELFENYGEVELDTSQVQQIKDFLGVENSKRWKPQKGENYYFVDTDGVVECNDWRKDTVDEFLYLTNNCFKTKEEAEFHLEKLKVYYELKNFADENNDLIDWENGNQAKFHIYCTFAGDNCTKLYIEQKYINNQLGQISFSSGELAEQAIKQVGEDRIKKYLFGVE